MSDSSSHRNHVPSRLMRESLVYKEVIAGAGGQNPAAYQRDSDRRENYGSRTGRVAAIIERDC